MKNLATDVMEPAVNTREALTKPPFIEASFPLASARQGLWFLHQVTPECGAYHMLFSLEVELNQSEPSRFEQVLADLMTDYPVLRTAFPATEAGPAQAVYSAVKPDIRVTQVIGMGDAALRELARTDSRAPFNLAQPPLWRVHLYQRAENRWLAVVVVHHILLDFWSLGLLLQDVAERLSLTDVAAIKADDRSFTADIDQLPPADEDQQRWKNYWLPQLANLPPVHGLPLDRSRPKMQSYEGASIPFAFTQSTSEKIKELARERGTTPFMVLLATWATTLHSLSGDEDWVIASPVAGRLRRIERNQLGQFVNTVPLRIGVDKAQTFGDILSTVRDCVVDAMRHQDCPFAWMVDQLGVERDTSIPPLSQIGFSWERLPLLADFEAFFLPDPPPVVIKAGGMVLNPFAIPQQEGQLELQMEMGGEKDGAFVGQLKYLPALFDEVTAKRIAHSFHRLAEVLAAAPDAPIGSLSVLTAHDQETLWQLGRGPDKDWLKQPDALFGNSILAEIATQVAASPSAIALVDDKVQLTYAQLFAQARAVAGALADKGVQPGAHVGLYLDRSHSLVTSILGIWLAGAAYVPLDPKFPADRLAHIAEDAGLSILLTESTLPQNLLTELPRLFIDQPLSSFDDFSARPSPVAYVLYTSGSTGKPKGVRLGHASVRNFLLAMKDILAWDADLRLLAITTTAFDISVLELFLPLIVGGAVVVADNDTIRDGNALAASLAHNPINAMQATPASWKMLFDAGWQGDKALTALCGGEPLNNLLADQLHASVGCLWNVYGPTETTVWSTAAKLVPGEPVHLGQPIANTQLYVLSENGEPVAPGAFGELWIGGDGLAIDYWNRPDLTSDRFVTLSKFPELGRLYRTGDKVRWNSQNHLEHHGRLDFQVKLRGYRIELGEIESLLRQQSTLSDAIVIVREDSPSDTRLVAYLIAQTPVAPEQEESHIKTLRDALALSLPAYMLPSAWVFLDKFPETPNRKIDRKALPAPQYQAHSQHYRAPADALELQLASVFGELLNLTSVGADDDFFVLGGHSLLAVQLVAAIRRLTGVDLAVSDLLQHSTVAALAARLRVDAPANNSSMRITLRAGADTQPLWLFHPIGGNVFCYLELTRQLDKARPIIAIQSPGLTDAEAAEVTFEAMAEVYIRELREVQPYGPYLLGGWCFGGALAFEVARQLRDAGEQVDGVMLIDTRAPIPENVPDDADDATLLSWFARDLATPYGKSLRIAPESLRALPPEAMFDEVLNSAKAIGVLPPDADSAALERYFQVYISNGIALRLYFPPADDIPVLLLRAQDETEDFGESLGWDQLTPYSLHQIDLPGDHNSIMYAPQAHQVAKAVDAYFPRQPLKGFVA